MTTFDADRDIAAALILDMPPVPDRVDDDEAWAAYCGAVNRPTIEQYAASILEFCGSPYAEYREQDAEAFREFARLIGQWHRIGSHIDDFAYRTARRAMHRYAAAVREWDLFARQWAEDQARKAFGVWS
jgi:hypothetical protein